jgi:hypothetical protein
MQVQLWRFLRLVDLLAKVRWNWWSLNLVDLLAILPYFVSFIMKEMKVGALWYSLNLKAIGYFAILFSLIMKEMKVGATMMVSYPCRHLGYFPFFISIFYHGGNEEGSCIYDGLATLWTSWLFLHSVYPFFYHRWNEGRCNYDGLSTW